MKVEMKLVKKKKKKAFIKDMTGPSSKILRLEDVNYKQKSLGHSMPLMMILLKLPLLLEVIVAEVGGISHSKT